jgi:hypothetical protein
MEQQVLEQYAQQHSETTFINLTGRGLGFDTIPYQTMDKIESMLPDREDIDHKIEKLIFNHSSTISLHQVEHVIGKLKKSFLKSLSLIGELSQLTPDSGLYALYELELANTDVYELVLKSCLQSIEKHFFLEGKDLTPKNKWAFLEEIIQYYLKFLP